MHRTARSSSLLAMGGAMVLAGVSVDCRRERGRPMPQMGDVRVVATSHLGGRLHEAARAATLLDRGRDKGPMVQVDAGDFLDPAAKDPETSARWVLAALGRMGIDAAGVGEAEVGVSPDVLAEEGRAHGVPLLAANVVAADGSRPFLRERLVVAGRATFGVFAVSEVSERASRAWRSKGFSWTDAVAETRTAAPRLRAAGATVVVGLYSVTGGAERARRIVLEAKADVDIVVVAEPTPASPGPGTVAPFVIESGVDSQIWIHQAQGSMAPSTPSTVAEIVHVTPETPEQTGVGLLARLAEGLPPAPPREFWGYASTEACAFCHKPELAQWQKTAHAEAFASLREGARAGEPECVGCHSTGYLQPGGTVVLDTAVREFPDVGCESCHGPSAKHVASVDKKKGTSRHVDPSVCFGCHTADQGAEPFDVRVAWKAIVGPGHGRGEP